MLLRKIQDRDLGENGHYYRYTVSEKKLIDFFCDRDNSVLTINLVNNDTSEIESYNIRSLFYMENITIDEGELLKTDALIRIINQEDKMYA